MARPLSPCAAICSMTIGLHLSRYEPFLKSALRFGQNPLAWFCPKRGVAKQERNSYCKRNENVLNHRRSSLMQVQVSLTIELSASANLSQMEQQIQEAGHQAMREAMKRAVRQWEEAHRSCPACG